MYVVLNKFLLSHQSLDFRRVPDFFKLFHSSDIEVRVDWKYIDKVPSYLTRMLLLPEEILWSTFLMVGGSHGHSVPKQTV